MAWVSVDVRGRLNKRAWTTEHEEGRERDSSMPWLLLSERRQGSVGKVLQAIHE